MIPREPFLIQPSQWYRVDITLTNLTPEVATFLSSKQRPTEAHLSCCLSAIPFLQLSIAAQECRTLSDFAIENSTHTLKVFNRNLGFRRINFFALGADERGIFGLLCLFWHAGLILTHLVCWVIKRCMVFVSPIGTSFGLRWSDILWLLDGCLWMMSFGRTPSRAKNSDWQVLKQTTVDQTAHHFVNCRSAFATRSSSNNVRQQHRLRYHRNYGCHFCFACPWWPPIKSTDRIV